LICNAKDLSHDQKAAIETLLGRRIQEGEAVSVLTFEPVEVSHQRRLEIANELELLKWGIRPLQKPNRTSSHPPGINQAKPFQMGEVVTKRALGRLWRYFGPEFAKGACQTACQRLKQLPLALGQVMSDPKGRNIAARKEAHAHCAGLLQELGLGMPSPHAQVNQSLRALPPTFHQSPPIEHLGDQGISGT